jgi:SAM-dependent methyltransferase
LAHAQAPSDWERQLKRQIGRRYGAMARDGAYPPDGRGRLRAAGYPEDWVRLLPDDITGAYSGCGFPFAGIAANSVHRAVDLGCGAGLDALYMAEKFPRIDSILGIDLAPEMLAHATRAAGRLTQGNIRFMAADMERLPLAPGCADLVTVNAALNLAAGIGGALDEIYRILEPGGRLIARDLVRDGPLPAEVFSDPLSYNTSLGGVPEEGALREALTASGFRDIAILDYVAFSVVHSVAIHAVKY